VVARLQRAGSRRWKPTRSCRWTRYARAPRSSAPRNPPAATPPAPPQVPPVPPQAPAGTHPAQSAPPARTAPPSLPTRSPHPGAPAAFAPTAHPGAPAAFTPAAPTPPPGPAARPSAAPTTPASLPANPAPATMGSFAPPSGGMVSAAGTTTARASLGDDLDASGSGLLTDLLTEVLNQGASDLHVTSGAKPTLRIHGSLTPMEEYGEFSPPLLQKMLYAIITQNSGKSSKRTSNLTSPTHCPEGRDSGSTSTGSATPSVARSA